MPDSFLLEHQVTILKSLCCAAPIDDIKTVHGQLLFLFVLLTSGIIGGHYCCAAPIVVIKTVQMSLLICFVGVIGGEHYGHQGGGSEYVCLPWNPKYLNYKPGYQSSSFM